MPHGHTDGDTVVYFTSSNVVHMGDHFFHNSFPYIDLDAGGTLAGLIRNIETSLTFIKDDTLIIPGHGNLATTDDLKRYLDMLKQTRISVSNEMRKGNTLESIIVKGLDSKWESWGKGFINEERWLTTLVKSLKSQ